MLKILKDWVESRRQRQIERDRAMRQEILDRAVESVARRAADAAKRRNYRAAIFASTKSDVPVVQQKRLVVFQLLGERSVESLLRSLINPSLPPQMEKALDDLFVVVRLAHADDLLHEGYSLDAEFMRRERYRAQHNDRPLPTSGPLRKLIV